MSQMPDAMQWLEAGVPLTLLFDLLAPSVVQSRHVYATEVADTTWAGQSHVA